jgi:hypothetical protein
MTGLSSPAPMRRDKLADVCPGSPSADGSGRAGMSTASIHGGGCELVFSERLPRAGLAPQRDVSRPHEGRVMSRIEEEMARDLHAICTTRAKQELAIYVLIRKLVGDGLDKEVAIAGPTGKVFAYLVPVARQKRGRLTPERIAELHGRATSSRTAIGKKPLE